MSQSVTFNNTSYLIPNTGDVNWGDNVTSYLVAIAAGAFQLSGGSFFLTAQADFGPSFGLASLYYKSRTANLASAGILRLAKTDTIDWRNNANSGDLALGINGSDQIIFNGSVLTAGGITALTGDVTATGPGSAVATLANTAVTPGSYTSTSLTVDSKGRITAASSGSAVTSITGTAHEIIASASTGAVTLSTPQPIDTTSDVTFHSVVGTSFMSLGAGGTFNYVQGATSSYFDGVGTHFVSLSAPATVSSSYSLQLPTAQGAANSFLKNDGTGVLSFVTASGNFVSSITGTANQVIASGSTGAVTLSLPQSIATTSNPTFVGVLETDTTNNMAEGWTGAHWYISSGTLGGGTNLMNFNPGTSVLRMAENVTSLILAPTQPVQVASGLTVASSTNLLLNSNTAALVFKDSTSNTITVTSPSSVTTYALTLPTAQGGASTFLQNNGSGVLTWASAAGSGTVNSGTSTHLAYYATSTTAVSDANGATISGAYTFSGINTYSAGAGAITMSSSTIAMGANKITGLANGTASTDAAAFGQIYYGFQAPVQATTTTSSTQSSSTFVASNLSASITPTSSSHRIKVTVTSVVVAAGSGTSTFTILRGGSNLLAANGFGTIPTGTETIVSCTYIDSPASTASLTYAFGFRNSVGAAITAGDTNMTQIITLEEIV